MCVAGGHLGALVLWFCPSAEGGSAVWGLGSWFSALGSRFSALGLVSRLWVSFLGSGSGPVIRRVGRRMTCGQVGLAALGTRDCQADSADFGAHNAGAHVEGAFDCTSRDAARRRVVGLIRRTTTYRGGPRGVNTRCSIASLAQPLEIGTDPTTPSGSHGLVRNRAFVGRRRSCRPASTGECTISTCRHNVGAAASSAHTSALR